MVVPISKKSNKFVPIFFQRLDFVHEDDIILNLLVNLQKAVSGKVALFKQQSEFWGVILRLVFSLICPSFSRKVFFQNVLQNELNYFGILRLKKQSLFFIWEELPKLTLSQLRKKVFHLKILVYDYFDNQLHYLHDINQFQTGARICIKSENTTVTFELRTQLEATHHPGVFENIPFLVNGNSLGIFFLKRFVFCKDLFIDSLVSFHMLRGSFFSFQ